jgi:hypothetical protein
MLREKGQIRTQDLEDTRWGALTTALLFDTIFGITFTIVRIISHF